MVIEPAYPEYVDTNILAGRKVIHLNSGEENGFLPKPCKEAKSAIWQSMIPDLSGKDAYTLASKYDFSGGQIENIARKSVVDKILTGEHFSFNTLCTHCESELIGNNNYRKIGF